jgi:DNA invertase Pin-like site-specific DNA recombinase
MVAEVCLGKVGAVCAREVSRFARNSADWQQLVEVCRLVDTLLIDQETVYSPRRSNDRLLLGLKGTMNEYELDLLRQRASEARVQKAKRGELVSNCPVGFVKGIDQILEKDPDRRIQEAISLVFRKCLELGSARQAALWFVGHGLSVPSRTLRGEVHWRRPSYHWFYRILTHPVYAGAYVYGRLASETSYEDGAARYRSRRRPRSEWVSLIKDSHEGYVTWNDFERIQQMIAGNVLGNGAPASGGTRKGAALLTGMLRCRRCGRILRVFYTGANSEHVRYACSIAAMDTRPSNCISFSGRSVDAPVTAQILDVVQPAGIAAAMSAHKQQTVRDQEVLAALGRDLEAARYRVRRAQAQYDAADPANRLVAAELEQRWNHALQDVRAIEKRIAEESENVVPAAVETALQFDTLAADLESVWNDPSADPGIKKRIVRALIEEIVVDVDATAGDVVLVIHWKGGVHTTLRVPRRRRGQNSLQNSTETVDAVRVLARICDDNTIAGVFNRHGMPTVHGNTWTRSIITSLRHKHGIACYSAQQQSSEGWMNLSQAAAHLGTTTRTLRRAIERGEVRAERPIASGPWILNKRNLDDEAVVRIFESARSGRKPPTIPQPTQATLDLSTT